MKSPLYVLMAILCLSLLCGCEKPQESKTDTENETEVTKTAPMPNEELSYYQEPPHLSQINPKETIAVDLSNVLKQDHSAFKDISFPQEGLIVADKAVLYNYSFEKIGEYTKWDTITVNGIHDVYAGSSIGVFYEFFYDVNNGKGLVKTRDVIPLSIYENPYYFSSNGMLQVVKNPISTYTESEPPSVHTTEAWYHLWLKVSKRRLVFLSKFSTYCIPEKPISFSPDEKYIFLNWHSKLFTPDGSLAWVSDDHFTSPIWHEDQLFLRGIGANDSLYSLNLNSKELRKVLDITEGNRIHDDCGGHCIMTWNSIGLQNGLIEATFEREDPNPPDYRKPCMKIEVTSDMEGNIIKMDKSWDYCC